LHSKQSNYNKMKSIKTDDGEHASWKILPQAIG